MIPFPHSLRLVPCVFLFALCLPVAGCSGSKITKANFNRINPGMTQKQVEDILGTGQNVLDTQQLGPFGMPGMPPMPMPAMKGLVPGAKWLKWEEGSKIIVVLFMNDQVKVKHQKGL
jgi:hypothetical protein